MHVVACSTLVRGALGFGVGVLAWTIIVAPFTGVRNACVPVALPCLVSQPSSDLVGKRGVLLKQRDIVKGWRSR